MYVILFQVSHLPQCSMVMGRYAVHLDSWDSPLAPWDLHGMSLCHCLEQVSTCGSSTSVQEVVLYGFLVDTADMHVGRCADYNSGVSAVWSMG